ncbi:tail fiber protein [Aquimarina aquimarini]|uniref:tail fiber protein n=1 Tax=Aquimarina aquimarini TaxID=1191734 RepID=UPI001F350F74|nr:tail fiber protein [Aquimarina aquimarini]
MKKITLLLIGLIGISFGIKAQNTFPTTGNVGIGTTTPNSKFEVGVKHDHNQKEEMRIGSYWQNKFIGLGFQYSLNHVGITSKHIVEHHGEKEYKSISLLHGKVGIGTTTPNSKFEVGVKHDHNQKEEMRIGSYWQNKFIGLGFQYSLNHAGITSKHIVEHHGEKEYKSISLLHGNVGIGTTSPDMKLTVKGNIHAEEVKIDLNVPAPDYVFKEDYKLRSIEEVENFIKENSHLPEIPSAKEFEQNGVMQAEMDMSLLKKIEELTLYTIQQEKKIQKLERENEELKSLSNRLTEIEKLLESKK